MEQAQITQLGDELYEALVAGKTIAPLSSRGLEISIEDAYHIQQRMIARRIDKGEKVIGKKIGVTSQAVMNLLGVHQPDFGYLLDGLVYNEGESIAMDTLIQPKAEGEIAFLLKKDLQGPGVTAADVLAATEGVMAWAFKQIEAGYFNQRHARIEMWVGRARNHIYLMPHVHQRLAQVLEVNTLPAAVGVAAIAEQGNAQSARRWVRSGSHEWLKNRQKKRALW